jgi:hypothetical protein
MSRVCRAKFNILLLKIQPDERLATTSKLTIQGVLITTEPRMRQEV